ncbi:MAG: hypothetical protein M3373_04590 [Gemmatimonadota bacterium]|nr:hypothetical protein [Gemmatimonadota bacterium]
MDLTETLAASRAAEAFKGDVLAFAAGAAVGRIHLNRRNPPIKVMRLLTQLLREEPELAIEKVRVDARSGCSDFTGVIEVEADGKVRRFGFSWCCRWRAEQEGWTDWLGFPDQIRAAREFGWRCFDIWQELDSGAEPASDGSPQLSVA